MFMRYVQNAILSSCILFGTTSLILAQEEGMDQIQQAIANQQLSDGGTQVVQEAQESAPMEPVAGISAEKALQDYCKKKGWKRGYDSEKGRIIAITTDSFGTSSPNNDKNFMLKREIAAKTAVLKAKVQIIEYVNSEMSAMEKLDMPGTDLNKKMGGEHQALKQKLAEQKEILAKMLQEIDIQTAQAVRDTELSERFDDLIVAVIRKLDEKYRGDARQQNAKAQLEQVKSDYAKLIEEYRELEKKAELLNASIESTFTSSFEIMAKMPLFGATAVKQMESWDGNFYQVAIAFCWSPALERAARAIVTGENFNIKPSGNKKSVQDWLDASNPALMVGPLQYLDGNGNRWFLGITARPYEDNLSSLTRERNKDLAAMSAMQMALFSLYADVESHKQSEEMSITRKIDESVNLEVADTMAQKLTQSIRQKKVRGLQQIYGSEMVHPITNQKIYVCAYAVNPTAAKAALSIERVNYATKLMANQHQTIERGRDDANAAAVNASANRSVDCQRGQAAQAAELGAELNERNGIKQGNTNGAPQPQAQTPGQNTGAQRGVFTGAADDNDDF